VQYLDCKYDILRRIGIETLNYKCILVGDVIQTRQTLAIEKEEAEQRAARGDLSSEEEEAKSKGSND
jgi:hypothetical protein